MFKDYTFNTLRPRQNGRHFADDIFKRIFLNENIWIPMKISLKFVPKGSINNIPALVQIMTWRRPGDKPLSELMMVNLPTHICVTRPQWVDITIASSRGQRVSSIWARFLSLARSNLRLRSANHRPGCWGNLPCDLPSTVWAYSEQETENGPGRATPWCLIKLRYQWFIITEQRTICKSLPKPTPVPIHCQTNPGEHTSAKFRSK